MRLFTISHLGRIQMHLYKFLFHVEHTQCKRFFFFDCHRNGIQLLLYPDHFVRIATKGTQHKLSALCAAVGSFASFSNLAVARRFESDWKSIGRLLFDTVAESVRIISVKSVLWMRSMAEYLPQYQQQKKFVV